jgi:hypothetical protein
MSTRDIIHALTPFHFGEFLGSEYNEAIRKLVDLGGIAIAHRGRHQGD